jgi:hypothetical protein
VEDSFIVKTNLGSRVDISIVSVPISSMVHPLCALPDYGSGSSSYIIVLPKCNGVDTLAIKFINNKVIVENSTIKNFI